MANLRETLSNAARIGAATLLDIPDAIDRLVDFPDSGTGILGQLDDFTDGVRAGLRDFLLPDANENPYAPGLPTPILPPAQGGQCPGVNYTVTVDYDTEQGGAIISTDTTVFQNATGPIEGAFVEEIGNVSQVFIIANGNRRNGPFETNSQRTFVNPRITSQVRTDGQPDECPENITPPPRIEDPVTYDPPTGSPITISPVLTFNPIRITVNNNLFIPIGIVYNDVDITANLNLNIGKVELNFGGGNGDGGDCCLPPQLPELPPADPDPEPDPDNTSRISGVIITVTEISQDANFTAFQMPQGPTLYFPDLGLISFRVRTEGVLSWTAPIRIQNRRQIIRVPWPDGAVDVAGLSRPGVNFTITVIYDDYAQLP